MRTLSERIAGRLVDAGLELEQVSGAMEGVREVLGEQTHITTVPIGPLVESDDELVKATDAQLSAAGCTHYPHDEFMGNIVFGIQAPGEYVLLEDMETDVWLFKGSEAKLRSQLDNLSPREV